ncbi:M42 family metallopeptidase [Enterococcus massiliensis]|uniref:M42 family metallopeptidase n=1 Tax=Enterococcus massiliensis TaxID=1640685 RepID=UPI00065E25D7|nr:M42 family metallopeptidase [Enterococcus massiliensis]
MKIKDIDIELLKNLSEADGIGGCEKEVSRIVSSYGKPFSDTIMYDNLGSVILNRKGNGPKVMLSSHMDEVGFMVKNITSEGFVELLPIGGWWGHVMPAQEMRVTTITGEKFVGVVGSRAPHGMSTEEKDRVISAKNFYLDLGVENSEAVKKLGIDIGDMVTPHTQFRQMNNPDYIMGKAWDDRVCVGVGLEVLKNLAFLSSEANVFFAASVQEEVGIRGARTATHVIKPDVAIALDVTTAEDTPFDQGGLTLGGGCVLSFLDSLTIANRGLFEKMEKIAKQEQLNIRFDFMTVGGTDACNIHKAMDGVVTMTLSIPTRYMHSSRLIVHLEDYRQTIRLLTNFICSLTYEDLSQFKEALHSR